MKLHRLPEFPVLCLVAVAVLGSPLSAQLTSTELPQFNTEFALVAMGGVVGFDPGSSEVVVAGPNSNGSAVPVPMTWVLSSGGSLSQTFLPFPAGFTQIEVTGISPNGRFIVGMGVTLTNWPNIDTSQGILWDRVALTWVLAGPPPASCSQPSRVRFSAVSNSGICLASSSDWIGEAYSWSQSSGWFPLAIPPSASASTCFPARTNDLSADGSIAVGWGLNPTERQAVSWDQGAASAVFLPKLATWSEGQAVSPSGRIVAGMMTESLTTANNSSVIWVDQVPMVIPLPSATPSPHQMAVADVLDSGYVCGRSQTSFSPDPYLWRIGWEEAIRPHDYLSGVHGLAIPVPGQPGATESIDAIIGMVDGANSVHMLVSVDATPTRYYLVTVPLISNPVIGGTVDFSGDSWLIVGNLNPSSQMTTIASWETAGVLGSGPYLGLHSSNPNDLLAQALLPLGAAPFRFIATSAAESFGPYTLPAGLTVDLLSLQGSFPFFGSYSQVSRFAVP